MKSRTLSRTSDTTETKCDHSFYLVYGTPLWQTDEEYGTELHKSQDLFLKYNDNANIYAIKYEEMQKICLLTFRQYSPGNL
jgi:hypothetical protein